jgi:hypothetical protein
MRTKVDQAIRKGHFLLLGFGIGISATSGHFLLLGFGIGISATSGHFLLLGFGIGISTSFTEARFAGSAVAISAVLASILPAKPVIRKEVNNKVFMTLLFEI